MRFKTPKLVIYLILGVVLTIVGCVVVHEQLNRPKEQPATPSVAEFIVPSDELPPLQVKARNGDCDSAHRLGMYHFFATLQYDEATSWFRIAAKCPNNKYKASLIAALLTQKDDPKVDAEIDNLILDMKKIIPEDESTKRIDEEVQRRRHLATQAQ